MLTANLEHDAAISESVAVPPLKGQPSDEKVMACRILDQIQSQQILVQDGHLCTFVFPSIAQFCRGSDLGEGIGALQTVLA